ncbi:probable glycosyltransferase STELLO1 [Haliotis rubra]|uniref:probable glycosyltransferase STELLO1 n=1 Tax=Haliotis rubra TaxID=36100 RepID=UPI001EE56B1A|nr:probable glycosyltransferase STELLO1 [Haliotis rubra]
MWGLVYKGGSRFNPYRHFGQPTLWPRGYPLSSIGENISTEYVLNHWKTPSIQQGVVNGDPDMDAIFRLTRKQTHSQLNVTFDDRAPPAIVPAGVFSPFNSQNTLFLYDAVWALLIPTTTTFRVCDIWRGYWAQRLLWEMGGNLGFFPPNAYQKRNSHSYIRDAVNEKDLYFQTERLVDFLQTWTCEPIKPFFACMTKLSIDMAHAKFWKAADADLINLWIKDLKALGNKEPRRIPFRSLQNGVQVTLDPKLTKQTRLTNQQVNVTFWAAEQTPPQIYSTGVPVDNIHSTPRTDKKQPLTKLPAKMFMKKWFLCLILLSVGCLLVIFINVSSSSSLIYLKKWIQNYTSSISNRDYYDRIETYKHMKGDRWIVLTTIAHPTPDVQFLVNIPGWNVVVVGDTKTPASWRLPNCVYLSLEDQQKMPFETVGFLPRNSYARKTAGYLYAISKGAQIIYETDDDNRPQDLLKNFVQERTMWGLVYKGGSRFNPYRHFGQPTLWPRGYPLSSIGENISTEYVLNHWKTPSIQQGVVNGDPDMDAILD